MKPSTPPNYKRIYTDLIKKKHPEKEISCKSILKKEKLSALDIIKVNQIIFGSTNKDAEADNQKHRSYNKSAIVEILKYQKKNNLNNSQLAIHFKLSRNTVAKWKKMYAV